MDAAQLVLFETGKQVQSIQQHLHDLLNSRQGACLSEPAYGLPDLLHVYQGLPYSVSELVQQVKQVIEKYEPRLSQVHVKRVRHPGHQCVLQLDVAARLPSYEPISFSTYFLSGGTATVLGNTVE